MPNMIQAGTYSAVLSYLKAVKAAGTKDTEAVAKKLKEQGLTATISLFSALRGIGMDEAADKLGEWLHYPPQEGEIRACDWKAHS